MEFLDPRGKPALNGGEPISGRSNRLVDNGAGLTEVVDHQRQFVAQPAARVGESLDGILGAAGYGLAQGRAGRFDLPGQLFQQSVDRFGRAVGRVGRDASQRFA